VLGGLTILVLLVWRLGAGPFLTGIRTVDGVSLAAAVAIGLLTTVCCAWRWRLVARGLGVDLSLHAAVPAYYRSQFLNTVLPGGVLGDVHRGVSHGLDVADVGRGLRAVAWERTAGQVVQAALALVVLLWLPSPVHASMPFIAVSVVMVGVLLAVLARVLPHRGSSRLARTVRAAGTDVREGLLGPAWPGIAVASVVVVAGHAATFLIAARTAGSSASQLRMLPLALLVLLAMGLPTNLGGWGPREGVAAWAFATAGLGASQGVTTAVVYGVMVLVASLPGAVVLVVGWLRQPTEPDRDLDDRSDWPVPANAGPERLARG